MEKKFLIEYEYNDGRNASSKWGLEIWAKDWEEARQKLETIKKTAIILGTAEGEIPIWDKTQINQN